MGALASGGPHRRPACGAKHHGGGGLGQPPADAIEASALRARPRWRGRSAPGACGEAPSLESGSRASVHARNLRDCRPDQVASSGQIFGTLSKAENLQRAFAGGGKGLARAAARPALAITREPFTCEHRACGRGTRLRCESPLRLGRGPVPRPPKLIDAKTARFLDLLTEN